MEDAQPEQMSPLTPDTGWQRWWSGPAGIWGWLIGGFSNAWFDDLQRRRAYKLGKRFDLLTRNLPALSTEQLQAIGARWYDVARGASRQAFRFAQALNGNTARLGEGLRGHSAAFADGLGSDAERFASGLGPHAEAFFRGLGPAGAEAFMVALGPRAGGFIALLEHIQPALDAYGPRVAEHLAALGPDIGGLARGLRRRQGELIEALGPEGRERLALGLGGHSSILLRHLGDPGPMIEAIASQPAAFASALADQDPTPGPATTLQSRRADAFLKDLGPLARSFLLALGPGLRHLLPVCLQPEQIFKHIAAEPEAFAERLRGSIGEVALALNAHAATFAAEMRGPPLGRFLVSLGPQLGSLLRWTSDPSLILAAVGHDPSAFFADLDEESVRAFAREIGGQAGLLGAALRGRGATFAAALGDRSGAFAEGLGQQSWSFVRALGGQQLQPPQPKSWLGGLWRGALAAWRRDDYLRGFLPALSDDQRQAWFRALEELGEPRISMSANLRCSLCHEGFDLEEQVVQCPKCRTILHSDCLDELAGGRCPADGEGRRGFYAVRVEADGAASGHRASERLRLGRATD